VAQAYADRPFREVLAAFGSPSPTPGGGSACAAAAALGTALLRMGAGIANIDTQSLARIEGRLIEAIDADAAAYTHVIGAQRAPKDTDAERVLRTAAIQAALRGATEVPLSILRLCASALFEAIEVATRARRSTVGDMAVAVTLLRSAKNAAQLTVEANLSVLTDSQYVENVRQELQVLSERADNAAAEAERLLRVR
jgi:formiminotetrahydrofolate cyclodeaminase